MNQKNVLFSFLFVLHLTIVFFSPLHICYAEDHNPVEPGSSGSEGGNTASEKDSGFSLSPVSAPVSDSLHGEQTAFKIQTLSALVTNTTLAGYFGTQCYSSGGSDGMSCVMAGLSVVQIGATAASYALAEEGSEATSESGLGSSFDGDIGGNSSSELEAIRSASAMVRKQLSEKGWNVDEKDGSITDPEGNTFQIDSFDTEDLTNKGFTAEAINGLQAAKKEADRISKEVYEATYEELEEQAKNSKDPKNPSFNLASIPFASYAGGSGTSFPYSGTSSSGKSSRPNLSKFLKSLKKNKLKKKNGQKDKKGTYRLAKYKRFHGKDRIGSRGAGIFMMLSRRMDILRKKKFL